MAGGGMAERVTFSTTGSGWGLERGGERGGEGDLEETTKWVSFDLFAYLTTKL